VVILSSWAVETLAHAWLVRARRALVLATLAQASITGLGCNRHAPAPTSPVGSSHPTAAPADPAPIPAVTIEAGKRPVSFYLQLAVTPEERANGLIGRPTLAVDAGLLFVFDEPGIHAISMKDTLIRTDIIFISADRRIVGIVENAQPLSDIERQVAVPSQYVLEIRAGLSSQQGFKVGQSVSFQGVPAR
jgi:uncharacterized membrane protein (UPF0127 family)